MDNKKYINICLGYKSVDWFLKNKDIVLKEGQLVFRKETNLFIIGDGIKPLYKLKFFSKENIGLGNVNNTADSEKKHNYLSGLNTGDYKHLTSVEYDKFLVMPKNLITMAAETPSGGHTGTTVQTLVYNKQIATAGDNTIEVGDILFWRIRLSRMSGSAGNVTVYTGLRSVAGIGTVVGRAALTTTQGGGTLERTLPVKSNTTVTTWTPTTVNTWLDNTTWNIAYTSAPITIPNITGDLWFWVVIQNASAADVSYIDYVEVEVRKGKI